MQYTNDNIQKLQVYKYKNNFIGAQRGTIIVFSYQAYPLSYKSHEACSISIKSNGLVQRK